MLVGALLACATLSMPVPSVVTAFLEGEIVSDPEFDEALFPADMGGIVSTCHWTPLDVARRAACLLSDGKSPRVLDIGSGVGKFCLVGALTTPATFVGVEQRAHLVKTAREAANRCRARRAIFTHSNVLDMDFTDFDAFYLYNPFYEQADTSLVSIDDTILTSPARYREYVERTCVKLEELRPGTRVVTYNGLGDKMPAGYRCVLEESCYRDALALWTKI